MPRFASALTGLPTLAEGLHDLETRLRGCLPADVGAPDLALVFYAPHFAPQAERLQHEVHLRYAPAHLLGACTRGVIGPQCEAEDQPAISLMLGWLPGVNLAAFAYQPEDLPALPSLPPQTRLLLLLGAMPHAPLTQMLDVLNTAHPGLPAAGGLLSDETVGNDSALLLDDVRQVRGLVGLAFSGEIRVRTMVSQGCHPIGEPLCATLTHRNVILRLENRPAAGQLQHIIAALPEDLRASLPQGIFVGRAISPDRETYGRGDFLIRPVIGLDERSGAIALGDEINSGDVVQFFVRDAETARDDLSMLLTPCTFGAPPAGALLFTSHGRGRGWFGRPNEDAHILHTYLGAALPLGGMFCAAEIGSVQGKNFLHGHTASVVLFG
ncbi:MAG: FIST C-terminal domain-containing protein [Anaerolineales bacterium]